MRIIDNYIRRNILDTTFMVLLVIVGLDVLVSFISELEELKAEYQIVQAVVYVLITIPGKIYEFLSVSILIGCLISLGALASSSELLVIRAAGVSPQRIILSVLKPILVLALLGLVLTQWAIPPIEQWGQTKKTSARSNSVILKTKGGVWHREGNEFIHIKNVGLDGQMYDINRFRFNDNNNLIASHYFKRAEFKDSYWKIYDASSSALNKNSITVFNFTELQWFSGLTPKNLSTVIIKPDQLSMTALYQYGRYLKAQGLSAANYQVSFWKKVFQPLVTITMVLMAISFIFGPLRSSTAGLRIIIGIVVGIGFQQVQQLAGYVSLVYNIEPFLAVFAPIAFAMIAALFLIRRIS